MDIKNYMDDRIESLKKEMTGNDNLKSVTEEVKK